MKQATEYTGYQWLDLMFGTGAFLNDHALGCGRERGLLGGREGGGGGAAGCCI